MSRYVKRPRRQSDDEASGRFWLKVLGAGLGFQILRIAVPLLLRLSYESLITAALVVVVVSAIWLRLATR